MTASAPLPGPSLGRLTGVELRKLADTRAGAWLLAGVGLVTAATAVIAAVAARVDDPALVRVLSSALQGAGALLPLIATLGATAEWSKRTATTTFALVPRRERAVAAKAGAVLLLALAALVAALAASAAATALAGGAWTLPAAALGRGALYLGVSALAGFAVGLAAQSTPPAIAVQLLAPIAFVSLATAVPSLADLVHWLDLVTPGTRLARVDHAFSGRDLAQLTTGTALWLALPLAAGVARLRRQDVSA
ncbi:MAG TPA: hypothetical protein VF533_08950 [Solirubrobacteraceae bacterium]